MLALEVGLDTIDDAAELQLSGALQVDAAVVLDGIGESGEDHRPAAAVATWSLCRLQVHSNTSRTRIALFPTLLVR